MTYSILIVAAVAACLSGLVLFKDRLSERQRTVLLKAIAVALFVLGNVRCFLNDNFIWVINGGNYGEVYYEVKDIGQSLLRWGMYLSYMIYPVAAFFRKRTPRNIALYFSLPVSLLAVLRYSDFIPYFTTGHGDPASRGILTAEWVRHTEFSLELFLMLLFPLVLRFVIGHKMDVRKREEWRNLFLLLPLSILAAVPVYLPQSLFGFTAKFMVPFTPPHFAWLLTIVALLVGLYLGFRFCDYETRYALCVFLSLLLFIHYNSIYLMDLIMSRMPLQLCNLGAYLVLLAVLLRWRGLFDFVLLANMPGALIALAVPDIDEGMLSFWNIHFYIEHTWVFIIPILAVILRVMKRPEKGAEKHFFIGFTVYFLICALGGIIANCVLYIPYHRFFNRVNYFYLFDTVVIAILPFLKFTRYWGVNWGGYTFFPLYMLAIYVLFSAFCLMVFYVYRQLTRVGDDHFALRAIRIEQRRSKGKYKNRKVPLTKYENGETVC